jgi:hypothetical protein
MEIRYAGHGTPIYPLEFALTSLTSGNRSVGIVRSWTKAMELLCKIMRKNDTFWVFYYLMKLVL